MGMVKSIRLLISNDWADCCGFCHPSFNPALAGIWTLDQLVLPGVGYTSRGSGIGSVLFIWRFLDFNLCIMLYTIGLA